MNHKSRKDTAFGGYKWIFIITLLLLISQVTLSQVSLLDKVIKLEDQRGTVEEVLKAIEQAGDFTFSYSSDIPADRWVEIRKAEKTVQEFLNELFNDDEVAYVVRKDKILIFPVKTKNTRPEEQVFGKLHCN